MFVILIITSAHGNAYAQYFLIERPKLGLDFSYEFYEEERSGPFINTENRTSIYSETLNIETQGWGYHPALLMYTLRLSPQWRQETQQGRDSDKITSRSFLGAYYVRLSFLQYKPYSFTLSGEKRRTTTQHSLANITTSDSNTYGATFSLKYKVLPLHLSYLHSDSKQSGFYSASYNDDRIALHLNNTSARSTTLFDASYFDTSYTSGGRDSDTIQRTSTLRNTYSLTEKKSVTLVSSLSYDEKMAAHTKTITYGVSENLNRIHNKSLSSGFSFGYKISNSVNEERAISSRTEFKSLGFNLRHQLYENLITNFSMDGSSGQFGKGRTLVYGPQLQVGYSRKIPYGGINIFTNQSFRITENNFVPDSVIVPLESVTLRFGDVISSVLKNENVDQESISITNPEPPFDTYLPGRDYTISRIGSMTRIECVPAGKIHTDWDCSAGAAVNVEYIYISGPAYDFSTYIQSYGINLNLWAAWTTYYHYTHLGSRLLSGTPPESFTDETNHSAGTEYSWKWSRTRLEFEDRQSKNIPLRRWAAREIITLRPRENLFLSLSGNYAFIRFKETGESKKAYTLTSMIQVEPSERSTLRVEAARSTVSSAAGKFISSALSSYFEWHSRIWSLSVGYTFSNEEDMESSQDVKKHYLKFEIRRSLF